MLNMCKRFGALVALLGGKLSPLSSAVACHFLRADVNMF